MKRLFLIGKRFGRLVVLEKTGKRTKAGHVIWKCRCDCGKETSVRSDSLSLGLTTSCGCLHKEKIREVGKRNIRHGHKPVQGETKEYRIWANIVQRCTNPKHKFFKDYGGRGIKVCNDWLHSFKNFLEYLKANGMYPKPIGMSIDRINNDGNYEPGNIRWATPLQQNDNQRKKRIK